MKKYSILKFLEEAIQQLTTGDDMKEIITQKFMHYQLKKDYDQAELFDKEYQVTHENAKRVNDRYVLRPFMGYEEWLFLTDLI